MKTFGRRGAFWSASLVLALCLWASGAPSVLYPIYAAEWGLTPAVTTLVFGMYPLALLVVLFFFGSISDTIGRRRAILIGVALIAASALVFAVAPNVGFLLAGRVLQGVGTGFALGAASAALVEQNFTSNPRLPSSLTTVSTSTGLTAALVVSGVLAQYAPLPLVVSFGVLFALAAVTFALNWFTPRDGATGRSWSFAAPRLPGGMLRPFVLATLSVTVAYAVGAIFLSLGADMARQLTGTTDALVIGILLGTSSLTIGVTALLLTRVPAHTAVVVGALVSIAGLGIMALASATGSIIAMLAWCLVGGVGYSFAFTGGLGLINRAAPAQHRGATLSLLYLFSYLGQAIAAIGAGALATSIGLPSAVEVAAPVLGILCLAVLVLAGVERAGARRESPAAPPAAELS
ncbi:MFS transporter [Microbacterium sp. AZCO]|uniref:MFS transporter n=1 Tax=Microbacterium sp. AZCO TaxID=3142976 RepID=UPI0031F3E880